MRGPRGAAGRLALGAAVVAVTCGAGAAPALALTASAKPPGAAVEGAGLSGTVASFTDAAILLVGCNATSQYSATITWGDGTTSPGTVTGGIGQLVGTCLYAVDGAHSYAEEGTFAYSVAITGPAAGGDTGAAPVVVRDAPLSASAAGFTATQATQAAATVATFTDANPVPAPADFEATVAWGDGTAAVGAIAPAPGGGFAVTASHVYAHGGAYAVSVTIKDAGGSQATATSTATVATGQPGGAAPGSTPPPPLRLGLSAPVLARGGTVVVGVRCPAAAKLCRGRLSVATVASLRSKIPSLRVAQILGSALFIIPGGRQADLSVRPKRPVVAQLRRAGSVEVAAYASSFDAATGRSQVASLTAKLKLGG